MFRAGGRRKVRKANILTRESWEFGSLGGSCVDSGTSDQRTPNTSSNFSSEEEEDMDEQTEPPAAVIN